MASNVSAFASQYGKSIVPVGAWKDGYGGLGKHIALKYQTDVNFIDLKFNNDSTWPNGGDKSGTKGISAIELSVFYSLPCIERLISHFQAIL